MVKSYTIFNSIYYLLEYFFYYILHNYGNISFISAMEIYGPRNFEITIEKNLARKY